MGEVMANKYKKFIDLESNTLNEFINILGGNMSDVDYRDIVGFIRVASAVCKEEENVASSSMFDVVEKWEAKQIENKEM